MNFCNTFKNCGFASTGLICQLNTITKIPGLTKKDTQRK